MTSAKTAVVIPNWNGADVIARCVDSLLLQSHPCTIIVVENGSTDGSDDILASYGNKIIVLKQPKNLGFAGGVNVGIRYAIDNDFDYVALFNNDAVADKNWLSELVKPMQKDKKIGAVTCKFMKLDKKTIDSTGDFYTRYGLPYPRGRNEKDIGQYNKLETVFAASGGSSLYSCDMFNKIGIFDETFFAYYEDVDVSFRAQLAGYKVLYNPKAIAYHHIGATSSKISGFGTYQTAKNFWMLYTKNVPSYLCVKYLPFASYWYIRMFAGSLVHGTFVHFISGWFRGLVLIPSVITKRHAVQKLRKVSTGYIDSIVVQQKAPRPPKA